MPSTAFRPYAARSIHAVSLGIVLLVFPGPQALALENVSATMLAYRVQKNFDDGVFANASFSSRFNEGLSDLSRHFIMANIGKTEGRSQYTLGYNLQLPHHSTQYENRFIQQYRYRLPLTVGAVDFTASLDERYFSDIQKLGARTRLQVQWQKPLGSGTTVTLGNQIFINFNDINASNMSGFNQSRIITNLQQDLANGDRLDFGYQFRFINRPFDDNIFMHQVSLTYNLRL